MTWHWHERGGPFGPWPDFTGMAEKGPFPAQQLEALSGGEMEGSKAESWLFRSRNGCFVFGLAAWGIKLGFFKYVFFNHSLFWCNKYISQP